MKTTILFALSFTLVACGGSIDDSIHGAEVIQPEGSQQIVRGDDVIFISVDSQLAERIQASGETRIGGNGETLQGPTLERLETAATLTVVMKHPMQEEAVLAMLNAQKLGMSCSRAGTWSPTVSKLRCLPGDGRPLLTREIENLPELLAFSAAIED